MRLLSAEFIFLLAMVALVACVYASRGIGRTSEASSIRSECHSGICTVR